MHCDGNPSPGLSPTKVSQLNWNSITFVAASSFSFLRTLWQLQWRRLRSLERSPLPHNQLRLPLHRFPISSYLDSDCNCCNPREELIWTWEYFGFNQVTSVRLVPKTGGNVAGLPRGIVVQVANSEKITLIEVNDSSSSIRYVFLSSPWFIVLLITQAPGQTTGVQRVMVVQKSGDGRTIMAVHLLFLKAK